MRVVAVANQKGGCGKTTTSINLAASLAVLDKKTLLIDLDPQGHSACGLGIRQQDHPYSLYDLLSPQVFNKPALSEVLCEPEPGLWVIPSYVNLSSLEEELVYIPDKDKRLKELILKIRNEFPSIECIVLDCPPNLGVLTANALEACDEIIIPIEPSFFSLHGLAKISETLKEANVKRNQPIGIHALLTIFDSRTRFAQDVYEEVKKHFREKMFRTIIHESVLLKESAGAGQSIVRYCRDSEPARDYSHLAVEYLERAWERALPQGRFGWEHVLYQHYGPRKVMAGILFQVHCKKARLVEIAGDFNNWIPEPMIQREGEEGLWQKVIQMERGSFRYKFIVDGEWQLDPYQPLQRMNSFGTYDSYVEI